ncbi:MAG: hypothetical protein KKB37_13015 [Alphaproteobacteria bacterium]|nr:hypothetical protein [Alphaproteobacteria bacterium]
MLLRGQGKPTGRRQRHIINDPYHQSEGFRFQTLFQHPERVLRVDGLDAQDFGRLEAKTTEAVKIKTAVLGEGPTGRAP